MTATLETTPKTRADTLHDLLRNRLFDGVFAPGEQVSIRQIAEAEGTSMIPARDALRGLVAEGALEFRGARAIAVPVPSRAALAEIGYARAALEGELAARAAGHLFGDVERLKALDATVDRAITDRDTATYMAANRSFHFAIYRAAAAPILLGHVELLWMRIGPSMRHICDDLDGYLPAVDHHSAAVSALARGDASAFRNAIEADIAMGMTAILERTQVA